MKITVKKWHSVASWHWNCEDVCGICRDSFDGCCPVCKYPGDDCPPGNFVLAVLSAKKELPKHFPFVFLMKSSQEISIVANLDVFDFNGCVFTKFNFVAKNLLFCCAFFVFVSKKETFFSPTGAILCSFTGS